MRKNNAGLNILKFIMCFVVVLCHFWSTDGNNFLAYARTFAVPIFMIVSFYFTAELFFKTRKEKFLKRMKRLILPQFIWTYIYFIIYTLIEIKYDILSFEGGWKSFFSQLFFGHSFNQTMWFQIDIIFITILFFVLAKIFNNKIGKVLVLLLVFCLFSQYSNINYNLFTNFAYEYKYTFGRIIEVVPFAIVGVLLRKYNFLDNMKKNKSFVILCCILMVTILYIYNFFDVPLGFGYQGLNPIVVSICIFTLFGVIDFSLSFGVFVENVTRYILGIYCMHRLVGTFYFAYFSKASHSILNCFVIFAICYFISFIICNLFKNKTIISIFD